jgi:dTMP kinase
MNHMTAASSPGPVPGNSPKTSPSSTSGRLIVVEGVDGAGKSTLIQSLAASLQARGISVRCSREPTFGVHGMALRNAAKVQRLAPERELELLIADRQEHLRTLIEPALAKGEWVLLDRYYFSTVAYQGAAGLDRAYLLAVNEAFARKPDLLLILDLPVAESIKRIAARGVARDDFEQDQTLHAVRETFLGFAALPYAVLIDARQTPEAIAKLALEASFALK